MSVPVYSCYRASFINWIGEIPAKWSVVPLRRAVSLVTERATQRTHPVALENIESWTGKFIETDSCFDGDGVTFAAGDILFGKLRPYLAKAWLATCSGEAVGDFHILRCREGVCAAFIHKALLSSEVISQIDGSTYGAKMPRASWDFLASLSLPIPSLPEQEAIVIFLDGEMAKIDDLIRQQEQMIRLLEEKRLAVISHAVTKGLNRSVPFKDSGVDWIGQLPTDWSAPRLSHVARQIVDGAHFTPTYAQVGVPFLRVTDITDRRLKFDQIKFIPLDEHKQLIERCKPQKGDLLLSKNGTIGISCVVTWDWEFSIFVSLCLIKLSDKIDPYFLNYVFQSKSIDSQINEGARQSAVTNLHLEKIKAFRIPMPCLQEQLRIVSILDEECLRFDTIISDVSEAIGLLRERRAALVLAAVTGKIDVRSLIADLPPLQAAAE